MSWISSTDESRWTSCDNYCDQKGTEIIIGDEIGKPLFGFGAAMNEIGLIAIDSLDEEKKTAVYDELFGDGCGFDFCRLSIGANDFAADWYSYNETVGDYEMMNFSIDRDHKYIIPAINEARKRSHGIEFFASPWSPPTWMKFPAVYNYGRMIMTKENLSAYALYFKKYLSAYKDEGVNIRQIHVQNEFHANQKFPSCIWTGEDITEFIADYLIDAIGNETEIWFGTINGPIDWQTETSHSSFLGFAMQNEKLRRNIKGASYQWAGRFGIDQAKQDYPELDTIMSEWECGDGTNTWDYAMYGFELFRYYFAKGVRACTYWNIALDDRKESTWGWKQNSLLNVIDGDVVWNPDFYMVKHFSHFVKKGAVMLQTLSEFNTNTAVFKNPDGSRVAVIMNPFKFDKTVTIEGKNYTLAPRSFNSIVL